MRKLGEFKRWVPGWIRALVSRELEPVTVSPHVCPTPSEYFVKTIEETYGVSGVLPIETLPGYTQGYASGKNYVLVGRDNIQPLQSTAPEKTWFPPGTAPTE